MDLKQGIPCYATYAYVMRIETGKWWTLYDPEYSEWNKEGNAYAW